MVGLRCYTLQQQKKLRSAMNGSFHNNLDAIFEVFETFGSTPLDHLPMSLVRQMLEKDPEKRPRASEICKALNIFQAFSAFEPDIFSGIQCRHSHHFNSQISLISRDRCPIVQELIIVIGNTCQKDTGEFVIRDGRRRDMQEAVFFVECSSTDLIESV